MVDENMAVNTLSKDEIKNETSNNIIVKEEIPLNLEDRTELMQDTEQNETLNGLENFELSQESPQLFNSDSEIINEKIDENSDMEIEEDELEIPAFLRRQKN